MITTGMSIVSCLICDVAVDESSCINICTSLLRNGESLKNFVLRLLRPVLIEFQGSHVCSQCHRLFQMLEQAQYTVANIHCEILKLYRRSRKERVVMQTSQNGEYYSLVNNHNDRSKGTADDSVNQIKSTVILRPVGNRIVNVSQIPWQDTVPSQDSGILDTNTVANIKTTKVIKSTSVKKEELGDSNKECMSYTVLENTPRSTTNSNFSIISSGFDINMSNNSLGNPTALKRDCNVNDNNTVERKKAAYTQQCKYCIELFKSYNELRVHMRKHENSWKHQDLEDRANSINGVTKTIIKDFDPPQDNQERDPLETHEINIVKTERDAKNIPRNTDCSSTNANNHVERNGLSISRESSKALSKCSSKSLEYSCSTCGKKWKTPAELRAHTKTHSTLRPYMCEKCGQVYKHKHALEVHVGMHNGINPFQCNYCNKCFTQKGALMRHLPMHTGETPYQCELCGKRFIHHTSYNMHTLSHTGKKSYQCSICNMFLLSTSHLKRHMRVHTGEKPYSCNLCGKRFAERYNLFAHRKIHDPVEIIMKEEKRVRKKCEQRDPLSDKKQEPDTHSKYNSNSDKNEAKKLIDCIFDIGRDTAKGSDYTLSIQDINTKETNSRGGDITGQTWIQSANAKLHVIEDQTKLVLLENCLSQIDASPLITFNDQNFPIHDVSCDVNPQISVALNASGSSINHIIIEKMNT